MSSYAGIADAQLHEERNILVVGKTGSGKSTVANRMLCSGIDKFKVSAKPSSETSEPAMCSSEFDYEGRHYRFNVIDTIGLFDTKNVSNSKIMKQTKETIKGLVTGLNMIVFVAREGRFTPEEKATYDLIHSNFAQDIAPFSMLVITGCEGKRKDPIISTYQTNPETKDIVSHMKLGVLPVGFPDLSQFDEAYVSSHKKQVTDDEMALRKMACKAEKLYLKDKLYDDYWCTIL